MKCFDKKNNRLVYFGEASDNKYWDKHWDIYTIEKLYPKTISKFDYVINVSKKYLKPKSLILEGGCGTGQQVFKLNSVGFNTIGVDYAEKTIKTIKKVKPELDVRYGDVRELEFENNYFDAYWSFGVIEHFFNGYDKILSEMQRVIKKNGYLFVSFPHMSFLRKYKAKKGKFPFCENYTQKDFYQFALDEAVVINDLKKIGFTLLEKKHLSGIKGLKDEIKFLKPILQKIYDSRNLFGKIASKMISIMFGNFTSHSILLVLQKK